MTKIEVEMIKKAINKNIIEFLIGVFLPLVLEKRILPLHV